jgi:hypothetical protein
VEGEGTKLKKLRRFAIIVTLGLLGVCAWVVVLSSNSSRELRISRELGSGGVVCRLPSAQARGDGWLRYGTAKYSVWLNGNLLGKQRLMKERLITVSPNREVDLWHLRLNAVDKSWELRVEEERPIVLCFGPFQVRLGTRRTTWKTQRN